MASKKITELPQSTAPVATDLFVIETASGTRAMRYDKLIKPTDDKIAAITPSANAAAHNGIFRGKDLVNECGLTIDQICQRISNGSFENLYIGDYFDINITTSYGGAEVVRCISAGFDTYWNNGDTAFKTHHAVIVTKNCFKTTHGMNTENKTTGGFVGSKMWTEILPVYTTAVEAVLGSHLKQHRTLLTNTISETGASAAGAGLTGYASNWAWTDTKLSLLSEIQVYGANVFSSSWYDTGCDNLQLPLFRLDPTAKVCGLGGVGNGNPERQWYWLRNVASATGFAGVYNRGDSNYGSASYSGGVRPLFCIG